MQDSDLNYGCIENNYKVNILIRRWRGADNSQNQSNMSHKWLGLQSTLRSVTVHLCWDGVNKTAARFLVSLSELGGLFIFCFHLDPDWPVPSSLLFPGHVRDIWLKIRLSFAFKVFVRRCSPALFPAVASGGSAGSWRPPPPHGRGSATCFSAHKDTCWTDRWAQTPGRTYYSSRQRSRQTGSTERRMAENNLNAAHSVWLTFTGDMFSSLMSFMGQ